MATGYGADDIRTGRGEMSNEVDAKTARERAKAIAEQRRAERRNRKRRCVVCGVEESDKTPLTAHPEGIGPACKDEVTCQARRAAAGR
ncbi:hypothetical protein COEX109129_01595 [Corallococcus exiguus]